MMTKNNLFPEATCQICGGRGFTISDGIAHRCSCLKQRALDRILRNSNLGQLHSKSTFDNFSFEYYPKIFDKELGSTYYDNAKIAFDASWEFAKTFSAGGYSGPGLMFTGPVGSGKTFLASAIANYVLSNEKQVLFAVVPDLLDEIRSTYDRPNYNGINEMSILDSARNVELLIFDDLGVHNYTEWTINKIYSILNYRVNHRLPIIMTTNLGLAELETYLGERTTSRILQLCKVYRLANVQDIRFLKLKD